MHLLKQNWSELLSWFPFRRPGGRVKIVCSSWLYFHAVALFSLLPRLPTVLGRFTFEAKVHRERPAPFPYATQDVTFSPFGFWYPLSNAVFLIILSFYSACINFHTSSVTGNPVFWPSHLRFQYFNKSYLPGKSLGSKVDPEKDLIDPTGKVSTVTRTKRVLFLFNTILGFTIISLHFSTGIGYQQPNFLLVKRQRYI